MYDERCRKHPLNFPVRAWNLSTKIYGCRSPTWKSQPPTQFVLPIRQLHCPTSSFRDLLPAQLLLQLVFRCSAVAFSWFEMPRWKEKKIRLRTLCLTFPVAKNGSTKVDNSEEDRDCCKRERARTGVEKVGDDMRNHVRLTRKKTDHSTPSVLNTVVHPIPVHLYTLPYSTGKESNNNCKRERIFFLTG